MRSPSLLTGQRYSTHEKSSEGVVATTNPRLADIAIAYESAH